MKCPRRKFLQLTAGAVALPTMSRSACAQVYPTRPVRLVVPFPPGGGYDAVGRPWADKIKPLLGTVVVENIGGGGSSLGAAAATRVGRTATHCCWADRAPISPRRSSNPESDNPRAKR
jgi:tripartite-type tricarboxylate transporter receptor subunit TctC